MNISIHNAVVCYSLIFCLVAISGCKKHKNTPAQSVLTSLSAEQIGINTLNAVKTMKPNQLVVTFDDGPVVTGRSGACDDTGSPKIKALQALPEHSTPLRDMTVDEMESRKRMTDTTHKTTTDETSSQPTKTSSPPYPTEENDPAEESKKPQPITPFILPNDRLPDSSDLVEFLVHHSIPATLFVIGINFRKPSDREERCVIDRALQSGHILVGNHTWSHLSSAIDPKKCNGELEYKDDQWQPATIKPQKTTNIDAFSRFVAEEVKATHCLVKQRLIHNFGEDGDTNQNATQSVENYPTFYRPPGGFWEEQDSKILLTEPFQKTFLGPVGWTFGGGPLDKHIVADYQCWQVRSTWRSSVGKKREEMIATYPKILTDALKSKEQHAVEKACAELYVAEIMALPPEKRKGILLLHDNHASSIIMFAKFLYPALKEKNFAFISLADVPYYADQIKEFSELSDKPALTDTAAVVPANIPINDTHTTADTTNNTSGNIPVSSIESCTIPQNPCSCCNYQNQTCCPNAPLFPKH